MKELQVMQRVDASAQRQGKSASERRKKRKRKRQLRKVRAIVLRAVVTLFIAALFCVIFMGGRFLICKFSEKVGKDGSSYTAVFEERGPLVVLDAGHGGNDQGTSFGKLLEKDINLKVAKLVKKELEKSGVRVLLTREDDRRVELEKRAALANEKDAALFVSIHCNYNEDSTAIEGMEFYYQKGSNKGKMAAEILSSSFDEVEGVENRGTREEDFHVLRETQMPAVLVELGFLSNDSDRKKLNKKDYQKLLAECIAETIAESEMITDGSDEADVEL